MREHTNTLTSGLGFYSLSHIRLKELRKTPSRLRDFAASAMSSVIEDAAGTLTGDDVAAIATYLKSLPAIPAK